MNKFKVVKRKVNGATGVFFSLAVMCCAMMAGAQPATSIGETTDPYAETPVQHDARMKWFREARFGMFIHWGLYSVAAGEWDGKPDPGAGEWIMQNVQIPVSQYAKLVPQFNPVKFDAREWVRTAKGAGMKYIVITTKHHDGFGLFPSELTDWCIKSTPFQRDPLKELAAACEAEGVKLCFYHSIMDWHHPEYAPRRNWNDVAQGETNMEHYNDYLKGELKELLTHYGPIGLLWFDGQWEKTWNYERGRDLYGFVRSLQPNIIVNNRVGQDRAGKAGTIESQDHIGDYGTPEQEIPATGFGPGVDWESCMTMNDTWGFKKNDQNWKSTQTLIRNLIDCASKGGNYLLNVGPSGEGLIPAASVQRLAEIGQWMQVNSEAVYDTQASPFKRLAWGRCTTKVTPEGAMLYLHVFNWPRDGKLVVPGLKNKAQAAYLLADSKHQALRTKRSDNGLTITVPTAAPDANSSTVVLKVKGALDIVVAPLTQNADGSLELHAYDAICHGNQIRYEAAANKDAIGYWLDPDAWVEWQFNMKRTGKYTVTVAMSAVESGAFIFEMGGQKLQGMAPKTGDYSKLQEVELGTIELTSVGKTALSVKAVKEGWQPLNLRSVRLRPVK